MANSIVKHEYNGFSIPQQEGSGYVDLTKMASAGGKRVHDYLRLKSTKEYFKAFSRSAGIPADTLIVSVVDGPNEGRGTWAHPEIAIDFAQWVNVEFRIWANQTLRSIIANRVPTPQIPKPTDEERIAMIADAFKTLGLHNSPRHLQLAQDRVANLMGEQPLLAGSTEPRWLGVVEIAEDLGYKAAEVRKVCSPLGRAVAAWYRTEYNAEPETEGRLVNGRTTEVNVYQNIEDVRSLVQAWLGTKGLTNLSIA